MSKTRTKTKFQDSWLEKNDCNEFKVSEWASKVDTDVYKAYCRICNITFSIEKGFDKIDQHAKTQKHKNNLCKIKPSQQHIALSSPRFSTSSHINITDSTLIPSTRLQADAAVNQNFISQRQMSIPEQPKWNLFSPKDLASRAELYTILDVIKNNLPLSSCEGKKELYQAMFPGCVPDNFSLSRIKAAYILIYALAPYFKKMLLLELHAPSVQFTLQFDETTNNKNKKELQLRVQFWSNSFNKIVNSYLETYFLENGEAKTIIKYLFKGLENNDLSLKLVLMLAKDGPNVNKTVLMLFQTELRKIGSKPLIDLGSCLIHSVYNGFEKGCDELTLDVSDLVVKIHKFFLKSDERETDFEEIQKKVNVKIHKFIKHCDTLGHFRSCRKSPRRKNASTDRILFKIYPKR